MSASSQANSLVRRRGGPEDLRTPVSMGSRVGTCRLSRFIALAEQYTRALSLPRVCTHTRTETLTHRARIPQPSVLQDTTSEPGWEESDTMTDDYPNTYLP